MSHQIELEWIISTLRIQKIPFLTNSILISINAITKAIELNSTHKPNATAELEVTNYIYNRLDSMF